MVLLRLLSGLLRVRIPSAVSAAVVQLAEHLRRSCDRVPQPQSLRGVVWGYFVSNTNGQCIQVSSPSALILYLVRLCSTQITPVPWRMLALLRLWIAKSASTIVYHGTHIIPVAWRRRYFAANEIGSNPTRGGTNPRVLTPSFASFGLTGWRHLACVPQGAICLWREMEILRCGPGGRWLESNPPEHLRVVAQSV